MKVDVIIAGVGRDANEGSRPASGWYCGGECSEHKTMIVLVNILETSLETAWSDGGVKTVLQY